MFEENKDTGETMSEGSDVPPGAESVDESTPEVSPIKEYFDGLSDTEKDELASLCEEYKSTKGENDGEPIDFAKVKASVEGDPADSEVI